MMRFAFWLYGVVFFAFLFGPLLVMGVTAFNTSSYPAVWPFEGPTLQWFSVLASDDDVVHGLWQSVKIGVCVVLVSVPCGLAGAMVMQQMRARLRGLYYVVVVSPVLTPGVIIGISTVIFWRDITGLTGLRALYEGTTLTVIAQSSFISAYCMLILLARLQRFDPGLEEAGLDLGGTPWQIFLHVKLPFLKPALLSASVLAFLSSFENYNTTTFSILAEKTLTTVIAGRIRQGSTPAISALAVAIVTVTVVATVVAELWRRRGLARDALAS